MENKQEQYDLKAFKVKAREEKKQSRRIFRKLKSLKPKQLDQVFHEAHEQAFERIDCLKCANCCKSTGPLFTESDIDRLARHFKISAGEFIDRYLQKDEDDDWVLKQLPCPFLGDDNYCGVYEVRPKACRTYPHTDRNRMHQILDLTERNASACPAVFEMTRKIAEGLKG